MTPSFVMGDENEIDLIDYSPPITRPNEESMGEGRFRAPIYVAPSIDDYIEQLPDVEEPVTVEPYFMDMGPGEFTSCVEVVRWPAFVWDTNGYYRDLGVPYWATKGEIFRAYIAKGGPDDPRLTFCFKQLINPGIRHRYDATTYGSIFFDITVADAVKNAIVEEIAAARAAGAKDEEEFKIDFSDKIDKPFEMVDTGGARGQDGQRSRRWRWGFYVWQSESTDTERLRRWQELLIRSFVEQKEVLRFSIGLVGGQGDRYVVRFVGHRIVAFLGDDEDPTPELADEAAHRVVLHTRAS